MEVSEDIISSWLNNWKKLMLFLNCTWPWTMTLLIFKVICCMFGKAIISDYLDETYRSGPYS